MARSGGVWEGDEFIEFVVRSIRFRMKHECEQLRIAHQPSDFLHQIVELTICFVS